MWEVTLPLLRPAIAAASLLVFLFCFTSFGVILILGGPRFATLEVEIYRQAVTLFRLPEAAAISLAQIAATFVGDGHLHAGTGARQRCPWTCAPPTRTRSCRPVPANGFS